MVPAAKGHILTLASPDVTAKHRLLQKEHFAENGTVQ
jgi:hypothetical protein